MLMPCRSGCGACCIAPSISSPIPGMPEGKPAGVRCVQLAEDSRCMIFSDPRRPAVCGGLKARTEMCSDQKGLPGREYALAYLDKLELATRPD